MLSFTLLGQVVLAQNGVPLRRFRSQKEAALLIYLAHTRQTYPRDFMADLLWNASTTKQALSNLRTVLARLRKQVGDALIITRKTVALAPEALQQVDSANLLEALANVGEIDSAMQADALQKTLATYRGDFLAGFHLDDAARFTAWKTANREQIRRQVLAAYHRLCQYALANGDAALGTAVARHWLQIDALDEAPNTLLIQLLLDGGQINEALTHYKQFAAMLQKELDAAPPAQLTAMIKNARPKPAVFTPPTAVPRHNLPAEHDQFFGRQTIQEEIHVRLDQPWCRAITITGQGGVGKSRLAAALARSRLSQYRDGVWFVELAEIDPDDDDLAEAIAVEIAITLDLRLTGAAPPVQQLLDHLRHKQALLILDNFEHVREGRQIVLDIARECERTQMIITSREALRIRAEWTVALTGLGYPRGDTDDTPSEAVEMFLARRAQHQWQPLAPADLPAVRYICSLVEGLPLAIELAAALTRHTTTPAIAASLQEGYDTLKTPFHDGPQRHRGLDVVFEMSWRTLPPLLQQTMARLSVFHGTFTETAAFQITETNPQHLIALSEKSLLTRSAVPTRYALHPVIRTYAAQKRPAADPTLLKHTRFYLALLARHDKPLQKDRPQESIRALEADIDNIRQAWQRGITLRQPVLLYEALRPLSIYYQLRGLAHEGEAMMRAAAEEAAAWGAEGMALATRTRLEQARFQIRLGQYRSAMKTIKKALKLARQNTDRWTEGMGQVLWGEALWRLGEYDAALDKLAHARDMAQAIDASLILGWSQHHTGIIHDIQGRYEAALAHLEKARAVWQTIGNAQALSGSLNSIGLVYYHQGDLAAAQQAMEQALSLCRQIEDHHRQSMIVNNLSLILTEQEDYLGAQYYLQLGLELATASGNLYGQGAIYANLGKNLSLMGEHDAAADYLEKGLRISESIGELATTATSAIALADVKRQQGEVAQAQSLYEKVLDIARQNDFLHTECAALIGMAELVSEIDREQARQYSAKAVALAKHIQNPQMLAQAKTVERSVAGG